MRCNHCSSEYDSGLSGRSLLLGAVIAGLFFLSLLLLLAARILFAKALILCDCSFGLGHRAILLLLGLVHFLDGGLGFGDGFTLGVGIVRVVGGVVV